MNRAYHGLQSAFWDFCSSWTIASEHSVVLHRERAIVQALFAKECVTLAKSIQKSPPKPDNQLILGLVGEEFADNGHVDREGELTFDLIELWKSNQFPFEVVLVELQIVWDSLGSNFKRLHNRLHLTRLLSDRDLHSRAHEKRASVDFFPVHEDMAVRDELLGTEDRARKAEAVDDVIEAALELLHEVLGSIPFLMRGFFEGVDDLLFHKHPIAGFELLLLVELETEVGFFPSSSPMLSWGIGFAK